MYPQRLATVSIPEQYDHYANEESLNLPLSLEFKYKSLQHEYCALENQFSLFSEQTSKKIASLEEEMDNILAQKERELRSLSLDKKNFQMTIHDYELKLGELQQNNYNLKNDIENEKRRLKEKQFKVNQAQKYYEETLAKIQSQLSMKQQQNQTLRQALNNERITCAQKQQLIRGKDHQISRLTSELSNMVKQLDCHIYTQQQMKNSNFKLKRQVEELKTMFIEVERNLKNCQNCQILRDQIFDLKAKIGQNYRRNFSLYNKAEKTPQVQRYQTVNYSALSSNKPYYLRDKRIRKKQLKEIDVNLSIGRCETRSIEKMRDSIFHRCKHIIDS